MAPTLKHGGHRIPLDLNPQAAAGTISSSLITYDFNAAAYGTYDYTQEVVDRATYVAQAAVTGAATNNFEIRLTQYRAGSAINQILYTFGSGVNAVAYTPIDIGGAVTGGLTNPTGVPVYVGWQLQMGDVIEAAYVQNGTGLIAPEGTVTIEIGVYGS